MNKPKSTLLQRFRAIFIIEKQDDRWFFGTIGSDKTGLPVGLGIGQGCISKKPYFWIYKWVGTARYPTPCILLMNKTFRWRWPHRRTPLLNDEERAAVIGFIRTHKSVLLRHWNDPYLDFLKAYYELLDSIEKQKGLPAKLPADLFKIGKEEA